MSAIEGGGAARVGRRRRVTDGRVPMWFGLPFLALGLIAFAVSWGELQRELRFGDEGASATGTVVALRTETDEDSTRYLVEYRFTDPAGAPHGGTSGVDRSTWVGLRAGDAVTVTYLPSESSGHRLGTPQPDLAMPILFMGVGGLFAATGPVLLVVALRQRRAPETGPGSSLLDGQLGGSLAGPIVPVDPATAARVDRFTRSIIRVVGEVVVAPVGGAALLGLSVWSLGRLLEGEFFFVLALASAFIGALLLVGGLDGLRRGADRRLLEVGPEGLWLPKVGHLSWSAVAAVRLEENRGLRRRGEARRIEVGPDGREVDPADRSVYRRLGIVPADPAIASRAPVSLSRSLTRAISSFANSRRSDGVVTDVPEMAPFGVSAYEVQGPFEALLASVRRFAPIIDARAATGSDANLVPPVQAATTAGALGYEFGGVTPSPGSEAPAPPLTDRDIRRIDAALGHPTAVQPTSANDSSVARPLVAPGPAEPSGPAASATFRRRGFAFGDLASLLGPGGATTLPPAGAVIVAALVGGVFIVGASILVLGSLGTAVRSGDPVNLAMPGLFGFVAIGIGLVLLRRARSRWRLATGAAELLTVSPAGLAFRDDRRLSWGEIESVTSHDGVLRIRPVSGAGDVVVLPLDLFETDEDVILDTVARYRIVDEE